MNCVSSKSFFYYYVVTPTQRGHYVPFDIMSLWSN